MAKRTPVIKAVNLTRHYEMGDEVYKALDKVNLEIYSGEFIIIFGPSGCGKSTLMSLLAGLDKPTSGDVLVRGESLSAMNVNALSKYRRTKIGMIFQQYNLISTMNMVENVALPLAFDGLPRRRRIKRAMTVLDMVGIADLSTHTPAEMSGGQQQRVGIARAWVGSPWIVFADEPTGNLDSKSANDVMGLLKKLSEKSKRTVVLITHNPEYLSFADRVVYLKDGRVLRITGDIKKASAKRKRHEFESLDGVGKTLANTLISAGYKEMIDLAGADIKELTQVKGLTGAKAKKLKAIAEHIMQAREGS